MFILLPLSLIGVGFLVYAVLAGATLALPIGAGVAAGLAASALGVSPLASVAIGVATFMGVIALCRFAALTLPGRFSRALLIVSFAVPAAIAGFSTANALGTLFGLASVATSALVAVLTAAVAAHRVGRPIS